MKRDMALRYARTVADRLHSVNGLLGTPNCSRPALRISRVWLFGSTVKGSEAPNDVDLLIECREVGQFRPWCRGRKTDKRYARSFGVRVMPSGIHCGLVWMTKGMRHVSRHLVGVESVEIDVKRLIYPKWEVL